MVWSERHSKCTTQTPTGSSQVLYAYNSTLYTKCALSENNHKFSRFCRSTLVETLHTILLGPYKYLLRSLMGRLTRSQKNGLEARLLTFHFSGLEFNLNYNIVRHFRSFVGRDFKALAQISLFLLGVYMTQEEKVIWLALSKVNYMHYIKYYAP